MKVSLNNLGIDTTLGELLATISDVAFENSDDTQEAYDLARLVLVEILKGTSRTGQIVIDQSYTTSKFLH